MNTVSGHTITEKYEALEDLPSSSIECSLIYCGKEDCEPGHHFGPIIRGHYMLYIITKGTGFFQSGEQRWELNTRNLFTIFPGENIYFETSILNPWSFIFVAFNGTNVNEYLTTAGLTLGTPSRKLHEFESYKQLVDKMLAAHELTFANSLRRNAFLYLILANLMEDYKLHSLAGKSYDYQASVYVKYTVNYLAENFQNKIHISDIADHIGISRNYLSICFKNEMGISPHEYLTLLRIEKAKNLLKNTNLSVQTISNMVGYDDPLAFSRLFKKKTDLNPKAYRRSKHVLQVTHVRDEYVSKPL